jgi:hypothetical protein
VMCTSVSRSRGARQACGGGRKWSLIRETFIICSSIPTARCGVSRGFQPTADVHRLGSCRGLSRGAMSARRPRQGEALLITQCVVHQINASSGRRTHEPCVPTFWRLVGGVSYDLVIAVCWTDCFVTG